MAAGILPATLRYCAPAPHKSYDYHSNADQANSSHGRLRPGLDSVGFRRLRQWQRCDSIERRHGLDCGYDGRLRRARIQVPKQRIATRTLEISERLVVMSDRRIGRDWSRRLRDRGASAGRAARPVQASPAAIDRGDGPAPGPPSRRSRSLDRLPKSESGAVLEAVARSRDLSIEHFRYRADDGDGFVPVDRNTAGENVG